MNKKITLAQVKAAVEAFEAAHKDPRTPPMSDAFDRLRVAAINAIAQYEQENNISTIQVLQAVREYDENSR